MSIIFFGVIERISFETVTKQIKIFRMYVNVHQIWKIHNVSSVKSYNSIVPEDAFDETNLEKMKDFSEKMQAMRIQKNKSVRDLADHIKINPYEVSCYERGTEIPTDDVCNRILFFLSSV